ncbi:MAG TPA: radical SAM protein [Polyangiaceae bacterium]|nr:radical SAM protein [Polyangiaceae bacterium]
MVVLPLAPASGPPRSTDVSVDARPALQALLPEQLVAVAAGIELCDARKLIALVHRGEALPQRSPAEVRRSSLDRVRATTRVPELRLVARTPSTVDGFVKYALSGPDGAVFEAVKIPLEHPGRVTVCVSSQVGCALGCVFCATGRLGLLRNLESWEIIEQVRIVRRDLPREVRVHGVVFQGMGEPLANWASVRQAARVMSESSALAVDARNITISTAGMPAGIRALAEALPNVRLALSIGSARSSLRRELIPLEARYPLESVLSAVGEHARATTLVPLFAYTLLAGTNDTPEDATALAEMVKSFAGSYGKRPRLSLIPYNSIGEGDPFMRADDARHAEFREMLVAAGVIPTRRYSGGADVAAACGQLAAAGMNSRRRTERD